MVNSLQCLFRRKSMSRGTKVIIYNLYIAYSIVVDFDLGRPLRKYIDCDLVLQLGQSSPQELL